MGFLLGNPVLQIFKHQGTVTLMSLRKTQYYAIILDLFNSENINLSVVRNKKGNVWKVNFYLDLFKSFL